MYPGETEVMPEASPAEAPAPAPKKVKARKKTKKTKKAKRPAPKKAKAQKHKGKGRKKKAKRPVGRPQAGREKRYRPTDIFQGVFYAQRRYWVKIEKMAKKAGTDRSHYLEALIRDHGRKGKVLKVATGRDRK